MPLGISERVHQVSLVGDLVAYAEHGFLVPFQLVQFSKKEIAVRVINGKCAQIGRVFEEHGQRLVCWYAILRG